MSSRIIAHTPLEKGVLLFRALSGVESLSAPFDFTVELLSESDRVPPKSLLGQSLTLEIPLPSQAPRFLNGKITAVAVGNEERDGTRYTSYNVHLQSDLWPLTQDKNFRIFQEQSVPQIIKTLLGEYNIGFDDRLTSNYRLWEYCVQYNESTFNFISRLMELEGIYYYFSHDRDKHTLILADAPQLHSAFSGYETIPYIQTPGGGVGDSEGISQWTLAEQATPGIYSLSDYDFRKPNAWLFQARQNPVSPSPGQIDVYEWPGRYTEHQQGEFYARVRQEAWKAEHQQIEAHATTFGIVPGHTFTLSKAPYAADNGDYLIISARYLLRENGYTSGDSGEIEQNIDFTVIPADTPWHPRQYAEWPKTHGPQTARVVGPAGESIWTDKYGRIKVKFHWDRFGPDDAGSSCWVRVSSAWAGQGYGGVQIPRVGDEVVVDFINGDPDRPIVIGRVYNDACMPPWSLPAGATQMGFLSRTKDGDSSTGNALRFEDKAGAEQMWLNAHRNMDTNVNNDATATIGNNLSTSVAGQEDHSVTGDRNHAVQGNEAISVQGDETVSIQGNETTDIKGNRTRAVTGNEECSVDGNRTATVKGDETREVTGKCTETITGIHTFTAQSNQEITVDGTQTMTVNDNRSCTVNADETQHITGQQTVTIGNAQETTITTTRKLNVLGPVTRTFMAGETTSVIGMQQSTVVGGRIAGVIGADLRSAICITDAAMTKHTLMVGGSGIEITPGKIEISAGGSTVVIDGSGVTLNGSKIDLNA